MWVSKENVGKDRCDLHGCQLVPGNVMRGRREERKKGLEREEEKKREKMGRNDTRKLRGGRLDKK